MFDKNILTGNELNSNIKGNILTGNELNSNIKGNILPMSEWTDKQKFDFYNQHKIFKSDTERQEKLNEFLEREERSRQFMKTYVPLEVKNSEDFKKLLKQVEKLNKKVKILEDKLNNL